MAGTQHARASTAIPNDSNAPSTSSRSRIHFPPDHEESTTRPGPKHLPKTAPLGVGISSSRRNSNVPDFAYIRRRVRSPDVATVFQSHRHIDTRPNLSAENISDSDPGLPTVKRNLNKGKGPANEYDSVEDLWGFGAFSDEYDLYPRILQDVQQALKLKARREARLKLEQGHSPQADASRSDVASGSSSWSASVPPLQPFPTTSPVPLPPRAGTSFESEIDFSPSTGVSSVAVPRHPVPSSSNNGATLDWSKPGSEDEKSERRWTLSVSRRKNKDQVPLPGSVTMQKQEVLYADKLNKIKMGASSQSLRKAEIIAQQLRRRYSVIYGSLAPGSDPFNPASVARWYGGQDLLVRTSLEAAEPLTWIKHLDKNGTSPLTRLPWHLSALIVEQYVLSQTGKNMRNVIPERHTSTDSPIIPPSLPPEVSYVSPVSLPFRASSLRSTPSLSRKRSFEGHVSFEPQPVRSSLDVDGRRTGETPSKPARSLHNQTVSPHSSIYSGSFPFNVKTGEPSPANSLLHLSGRIRRRPREDIFSSSRNSVSERSEDDTRKPRLVSNRLQRANVDLQSESGESIVDSGVKVPVSGEVKTSTGSLPEKPHPVLGFMSEGDSSAHPPALIPRRESLHAAHRAFVRHRGRQSLGSLEPYPVGPEQKRQQEVEDEKTKREYHLKTLLLDDMVAQNQRIRQLLKRVAIQVKEYDSIQSSLVNLLGVPYRNLPPELLDAFSHDPSVGLTRKSRGWRAVEDIHSRIFRQREAFQDFFTRKRFTRELEAPPILESVLHDPITTLLQTLETLEARQQEITTKAQQVADTLTKVKTVHAAVKASYNDTLSHTSVVYPELSHIVALEESYKDQYQQFWEFGMDALTFLLDTVAPFWRTYGKTIGEDVQDFLIIPLYRNEFTGEAKRYPIKELPRRSFRHWIGLLLFFLLASTVTSLQTRAAITSSIYFRLQWIGHVGFRWIAMPFFWIGIIIQWCAALTEVSIVITQLAVVTWWIGWWVKIFN